MTIQRGAFENLIPSEFISFTFPNPLSTNLNFNTYADSLRVAVLDSPQQQTPDPPKVAAMLVPLRRENDWLFSTKTGHLQLLLNSPGISRLILVGNPPHNNPGHLPTTYIRPICQDTKQFEESLTPLLIALSPKSSFINNNFPQIPFVTYEDNVSRSISVYICTSSCVGEMLVEDVEIESSEDEVHEFRRRLRFKRMPNLIQTEIRIIPVTPPDFNNNNTGLGRIKFRVDTESLVHAYLPPMVASLSLIATHLEECCRRPHVLCIGVGGGALLSFLQTNFGFQVSGVESDEMVVKVAKQYFGLVKSDLLQVFVGDGIELIQKLKVDSDFDIIMVDLDASDAGNGLGAPPMEFITRQVLLATKLALHKHGILVINVIPVSKAFYDYLISEFREVFVELYEINVGNEENYVLIAAVTPITSFSSDRESSVMMKLKQTIPNQYIDCIRKL